MGPAAPGSLTLTRGSRRARTRSPGSILLLAGGVPPLRRAPSSGGAEHGHAPLPGGHAKGSREAPADVMNDSFRSPDEMNESFMTSGRGATAAPARVDTRTPDTEHSPHEPV